MYLIGKVIYSQVHSLLPREASLVKIISKKSFKDYNKAMEYIRKLHISGDYSFVPVELDEKRPRLRKTAIAVKKKKR